MFRSMTVERSRVTGDAHAIARWRKWGPYLADRAWGTVREDYGANSEAWTYLPHDRARSKAYRWGEDGIGGFCDRYQILCWSMAFWNERDPILKERFFGLIPTESNHGEDVKERYFYLDALPSHAYQRMLYKYPQRAYPYAELIAESERRGATDPEFELLDTGTFADNETNAARGFGPQIASRSKYTKDAFHRFIVNGESDAVNPENRGTKMCAWQRVEIDSGQSHVMTMRLSSGGQAPSPVPIIVD